MEKRGKVLLISASILFIAAVFFIIANNMPLKNAEAPKTITGSAGSTGSISITILPPLTENITEGAVEAGRGGRPTKAIPKEEINITKGEVIPPTKVVEAVEKGIEAVEEGVEIARKAFIITRKAMMVIYILLILILIILAILIYLKIIKPATLAYISLGPRRRFIKLANMTKKALKANDIEKAKEIYNRMRFNYYFLNSKDKEAVKNAMDETYLKINSK